MLGPDIDSTLDQMSTKISDNVWSFFCFYLAETTVI